MNVPTQPTDPADLDARMMALALREAEVAGGLGEVPVGAVVYRGEEVLGTGHNLREASADPTGHAEILALRAAAKRIGTWRLDGCSLAVTLEPCPMCAGAMLNARLGRLVYGCADPKMGCVDTLHRLLADPRFNHRVATVAGVDADRCAEVLREFFRARRGADKPTKPRPG